MNVPVPADAPWDGAAALRDASALATLARDCVTSGVERRALHVRLSLVSDRLREPRHERLVREALAPMLRPTRARLYELPGGDLVALSPPPAEHLDEVRRNLSLLLPEIPAEILLPVLRLPAEAARLLTLVEAALGLEASLPVASPPRPNVPPPSMAELDGAQRALLSANLTAFLRRRGVWRLGEGDEHPQPLWTELRPHLPDLVVALLPGRDLTGHPALARRFRQAVERRMLAELAPPQEARLLGETCLPLLLGSALEAEFLRLDAALGPHGRTRLLVAVPASEWLADPGGFTLLQRLSLMRGWTLALDEVEAGLLRAWPGARLDHAMLRLRFRPEMLAADAVARASLDAALPEDRNRVILTGAETPAAIAWGWQRGITRFMGRVLEAR